MDNSLQKLTSTLGPNKAGGVSADANAVTDVEGRQHNDQALSRPAKIGLWTLAIGFGGFLLWAAVAPLDEGVPAYASVAIDTKRKSVQHLTGGIVREVMVREGDQVTKDQPLIKIDDAVSRANFETMRQRYLGFRAMEGRLLAERLGQSKIQFHPELMQESVDPLIAQQLLTQEQLFGSRRSSLQSELKGLDQSIEGLQAQLKSFDGIQISRQSQLRLISEELGNTRELVKEGYVPRNRQLELERQVAEVNASLTELQGNTVRTQQAILELRQRAITRQQDYRKEVESQLAEVSRELQADAEKFRAAKDDLARTVIKAPVAGQVVGLLTQSVGGVVQPGQKLMDIVPQKEELILEARVAPNVIDHVHAGQSVDIRFSAFSNSPQLVVEGKVASISGDLLTDPATNMGFYLARVNVTPEGLVKLGKRQMHPGMPAEVVLKTGERSLLTYILHPLTKRVAASMKEQ